MKRKRVREVFLHRDPNLWSRLPTNIKEALFKGTDDVKRIRGEIARTAQVSSMPLVRILAEVWPHPAGKGFVEGRAGFLLIGGEYYPGITLSARPVVCGDDEVLRSVLLHEFAHCFRRLLLIYQAEDSGIPPTELPEPDDLFEDEAYDREMLADPADWFGEEDVRRFVHWSDSKLHVIHRRAAELDMESHLPIGNPVRRFKVTEFVAEDDIEAHVRKLLKSRAGPQREA